MVLMLGRLSGEKVDLRVRDVRVMLTFGMMKMRGIEKIRNRMMLWFSTIHSYLSHVTYLVSEG
jgi:hypothetical protein